MGNYAESALVRSMSYLANVQGAIAHNLANVDTKSFKRRSYQAVEGGDLFAQHLQASMPTIAYGEHTDWRPGVSRQTGNKFDVALDQRAFMRVQDDEGRIFYTRDGEMRLDDKGRLVTRAGLRYLDANNTEITLLNGDVSPSDITISPNGTIAEAGGTGQTWGPLGLWQLPDRNALQPRGDGLYVDLGGQSPLPAPPGAIQQGYVEGSNVDSLQEMVQMILVQRTFGATQRALTGVGRMSEQLIESVR